MKTGLFLNLIRREKATHSCDFEWPRFLLFILVGPAIILIGCKKPTRIWTPNSEVDMEQIAEQPLDNGPGRDLPRNLNSAKAAALYISTLPNVDNSWINREIELHTALFLASYNGRLGDATYGFLLDEPKNAEIEALAIDLDEFRLRVLAGLSELRPPFEWAISSDRPWGANSGTLQGSPTHLSFRITERINEQATVLAEISAKTPGGRSLRQRVTCSYDGQHWTVTSTGLRTVW